MTIPTLKRTAVALMCLFALSSNVNAAVNDTIKVVTFNILGPLWADPSLYPASAVPFLDRNYRIARISSFLQSRPTADIITLQEVTVPEYNVLVSALGKKYASIESFHTPAYWSQYITVNPPWEPNGNAIFLKRASFSNIHLSDVPLSNDGNHAAYAKATHSATGKSVRAISVHLDSDRPSNREQEFAGALGYMPPLSNTVDIISGDFNIDLDNTNLQLDVVKANFVNVLGALGINDVTSPYSAQYYAHSPYGNIDHILGRNITPVDGVIDSNNLFVIYPDKHQEDQRVTQNLQITGSDHFSVEGTVKINP